MATLLRDIIALMMATGIATSAPAQDDSDIPLGLADTRRIESFANGDIRHSPSSGIYFFVARAADKSGQFWLQCERRGPFTVAVALVGAGDRPQRSQLVTIQADRGPARQLDLVVFENFIALATRHEGKPNENASVFMEVLDAAKRTFTVSYGGQRHDFDVRELTAPRRRFLDLCRQIAS